MHPFRKSLAELQVGDSVTAGPRTVTRADIEHFAEFTGDTFYAHTDEAAATANPLFGGIVAHGYLVLSFAAGLFVAPEPGPVLANYGLDKLRFRTPVRPGDELIGHADRRPDHATRRRRLRRRALGRRRHQPGRHAGRQLPAAHPRRQGVE